MPLTKDTIRQLQELCVVGRRLHDQDCEAVELQAQRLLHAILRPAQRPRDAVAGDVGGPSGCANPRDGVAARGVPRGPRDPAEV